LTDASNKYAKDQGNHTFNISPDEFRLFLAILFTTGYNLLPRRRLYWEPSDDVLNVAISKAMTRNRFDDLMKYLHVADNDNLAVVAKFAKVRPLFNKWQRAYLKHLEAAEHIHRLGTEIRLMRDLFVCLLVSSRHSSTLGLL
jgi:hypothetical protein